MEWILEESWREKLKDEMDEPYYRNLVEKVREEYENKTCYPPEDKIFNALNLCPFDKVKVVIMGQDPYFNPGQAMGLSFSVPEGVQLPPSLKTLYRALGINLNGINQPSGDLTRWAEQGVLLLNTVLTVREKQANSHRKYKWRLFTDAVIKALDAEREHIVFMLWGRIAQRKERFIRTDNGRHMVLKAIHPSPAVRRKGEWNGKEHFTCCNKYLNEHGIATIDWMVVSEQVDE
ncbi:uracil-DNA glycosylase [Prevotella melaninogenica]|uniref:Uracil-DNA glycosylase n=1 Tax=Prevotella melaninogenica TaxID=28132 RepID=A0A250KKK1_9BACT|nr:uracil-DNA glycosylase [Prevotella melaninogenica]BBA28313.1 uracil-DNA glycosylase 2 [Prevotella melaninogenica]